MKIHAFYKGIYIIEFEKDSMDIFEELNDDMMSRLQKLPKFKGFIIVENFYEAQIKMDDLMSGNPIAIGVKLK